MIPNKEDILKIIDDRAERLEAFLIKNSSKWSVSKLKKSLIDCDKEVRDAKNFSKEHDSKLSKEKYGFIYTLMNEYSAFTSYYLVSSIYIKKLEKKFSISQNNKK